MDNNGGENGSRKRITLGQNTTVTATALVAIVGSAVTMATVVGDLRGTAAIQAARLDALEKELRDHVAIDWTLQEQAQFMLDLDRANRDLRVPDIKNYRR